MKQRVISLFICILAILTVVRAEENQIKIRPALVRMSNEKFAPGIDLKAELFKRDQVITGPAFPRHFELDFRIAGTLIPQPEFNPKNQNLNLFLGYLISFRKSDELVLGREEQRNISDFGALRLGARIDYEANQKFSEQNMGGGAELRFTNASKIWMPVLFAAYSFVLPLKSELRQALDEDKDHYQRIDLELGWTLPVGPILIEPNLRYFYSVNLSDNLANAGLDKGWYGSLSLGYVLMNHENGLFRYLHYVFLQYNRGQLPVYLSDKETLEAGLNFRF